MNYYNEFDAGAAAWLRELIADGQIPAGDVDERSIEDVRPVELMGYTQCHFFAGIGGWPLAIRLAGIPETFRMWTGSCPCQPFSAAGSGAGTDDPRHLWPHFAWLIRQCRPAKIAGEQVASAAGRSWFAGVRADLEALGYAVAGADLCAAGVGAPHIRQRLFWLADSDNKRFDGKQVRIQSGPARQEGFEVAWSGVDSGLANAHDTRLERHGRPVQQHDAEGRKDSIRHGATSGFWRNAEYVECQDGYRRPIKPGLEPLAYGLPRGMAELSLKGIGNAIVPQLAAQFLKAGLNL